MPIEIKELHIRVAVDGATAAPAGGGPVPTGSPPAGGGNVDAIVAACVEQVMQVLQTKMER